MKASIKRDRFEIFNYSTKEFIIIDGPDLEIPKFTLEGPANNKTLIVPIDNPYRYRDIAVTEKCIYALYGGINEKEYRQTAKLAEIIYVFSHEGNPIIKIDLDRSLQGIVVNETKNEIYGLTTDEDPGIAVFKIPQELH